MGYECYSCMHWTLQLLWVRTRSAIENLMYSPRIGSIG